MTLQRILSIATAASLAALACPPASADTSDQEGRLLEIRAARAPLTLSGDGAWRLHVDAHDVLHRVGVADPTRESTAQLPPGVRALSASSDGLKVALTTRRQCVGLVDFGARSGDAAKVSWRPWVLTSDGVPLGPETAGWVAQMPAVCGDLRGAAPAAISSDGKLIATADAVIDSASNRVVASLPTRGVQVLRLQFVDHDARLLIAAATLGERRESTAQPSSLDFSVWDLASKALVNDVEVTDTPLATRASLQVDFSPQTGALFYVDDRGRDRAQQTARPGETPLPLDLVQLAPGACGAAPRTRAQVGDDVGASFVVDPYGRWFASAHPLDATHDAAELATGARSVLVVQDMATGRQLERVTSRYALDGLVAAPDGATLFALAAQPVEPATGDAIAGWPAVPDDEQLVEVKLPGAAVNAVRDAAKAWETGVCKERGEAPGARAMARSEHLLRPLWARDLGAPAPAPEDNRCGDAASGPTLFKTPDGGFWIDQAAQVARLDPLTGALAPGLPTPRTKNVCSVVTPAGTGFLNASGDTLTWRPLAAATDPARRRVVERRPGWTATFAPPQLDVVRVIWLAANGTPVAGNNGDGPQNVRFADYDSNGKRLREITTSAQMLASMGTEELDLDANGHLRQPAPPCFDARGTPLSIGFDWRAGPFGSQRGVTCGPLPGASRLVWWSGASIAPRVDDSEPTLHVRPAIDGAIAVVADEQTLHIVNLALQREIAQVDVAAVTDGRAWVLASKRLLLVEATAGDGHAWLRAYALP